ncbi:hypothetical protein DCC62_29480 [candidate division KSB1 bacterium]|nr:MAG: hypothetical protein DCC62_29480 [candidate division KSB1 bacterium]
MFSEGALRATLGFVVERLRRIRAAHTEQHRTAKTFHAKTQSRKGSAKKNLAGSLRLRVFA